MTGPEQTRPPFILVKPTTADHESLPVYILFPEKEQPSGALSKYKIECFPVKELEAAHKHFFLSSCLLSH